MQACPRCGFLMPDADDRCIRCGAVVRGVVEPDPLVGTGGVRLDFSASQLRAELAGNAPRPSWPVRLGRALAVPLRPFVRACHLLRERFRFELPTHIHRRNAWLAGALALIPGLGQIYNGQPRKAAIFLAVLLLLGGFAAATFYHPLSNWVLVGYLLLLLVAFNDGVVTAKRISRDFMTRRMSLAFYCAWIFFVSLACMGLQFFGRHYLVRLRYISEDALAPHLRRGERIAVDVLTYLRRDPVVGEIVYYDAPALTMECPKLTEQALKRAEDPKYNQLGAAPPPPDPNPKGLGNAVAERYAAMIENNQLTINFSRNNIMIIDPPSRIERVVGGPGDTFESRGGKFFRNGRPVPAEEQPLAQRELPPDFKLTAPSGYYIILFSFTGDAFDPGSMQPSFNFKAPALNDPDWVMKNWPQASTVKREAIEGRPWFVYNPPPARRMVQ